MSYDKDGISIDFPALPGCFASVESEDEVFHVTKEFLLLHLWSMENFLFIVERGFLGVIGYDLET